MVPIDSTLWKANLKKNDYHLIINQSINQVISISINGQFWTINQSSIVNPGGPFFTIFTPLNPQYLRLTSTEYTSKHIIVIPRGLNNGYTCSVSHLLSHFVDPLETKTKKQTLRPITHFAFCWPSRTKTKKADTPDHSTINYQSSMHKSKVVSSPPALCDQRKEQNLRKKMSEKIVLHAEDRQYS